MISRFARIGFLLSIILSGCVASPDAPSANSEPTNFALDNLPVVTQVKATAPCYVDSELLGLLYAQNYTIFSQIINSSNGYLFTTFHSEMDVAGYMVVLRAPPLACVIAIGVGVSGA